VEACPVKNTLEMRSSFTQKAIPNWVFGTLVAGVFVAITGLALITGNWQNKISEQEYAKRFKELNSPLYQHFQGKVPEYNEHD
jgi:hypothetical protein